MQLGFLLFDWKLMIRNNQYQTIVLFCWFIRDFSVCDKMTKWFKQNQSWVTFTTELGSLSHYLTCWWVAVDCGCAMTVAGVTSSWPPGLMSASGPASASILALLHRGMELMTPPMMWLVPWFDVHWSWSQSRQLRHSRLCQCPLQARDHRHRSPAHICSSHHTRVSVQQLVQEKLKTTLKLYFHQQPAQNFPTILVRIIWKSYTKATQYHHPHLPKISYRQLPPWSKLSVRRPR